MDKNIIKIAVLSEFWENQKKDIVDLLIPFVQISINGNYYGIHKIIDFNKTHSDLKERVSTNFTGLLLNKILKRMVSFGDIEKKDDSYCVFNEKALKEALRREEEVHNEVDRNWNELIEDLKKYIKKNDIFNYFRMDKIENNLWDALSNRLSIDNDKHNICDYITVGSYILEKNNLKDKYYDIMNRLSCSIFISNSIEAFSITKSDKFDYDKFYFDTRFTMSILGLNNEFDNKNASELMQEIINCNANMYIFKHNYDEIINVINQYIKQKFHYGYVYNSIDYFEKHDFSETRCEIFRDTLKEKINEKKISIIDDAKLNDDFINKYEKEFDEYYIEKDSGRDFDKQNYLQMLNIDVNAENKTLFVCTSNSLYKLFKDAKHDGLLFISDTNLASLLFANFNSNCSNVQFNSVLSKSWLIQMPDIQTTKNIFDRIKAFGNDGKIDNRVLYYFQTNKMALRELYLESLKTDEELSVQSIENIANKYIELQVQQERKVIIEEKNKEVKEYIDKLNDANKEKQNVSNKNIELKTENDNLLESLQISNEKNNKLQNENIELRSQHKNDDIFISNTKKSYRFLSNFISLIIVMPIVVLLLYVYIMYFVKLVIPEFNNNFQQFHLFALVKVIPLFGLCFVKKIYNFFRIIYVKISDYFFNTFMNKLST